MEAGNTAESIKPTSIFEKIKENVETEIKDVEAKIEGVFESAKEEPATVETEVEAKAEGDVKYVESSFASRLAAFEAEFESLKARIENFNKRSGHSI